ncbi:MAG: hypothetical protein L0338_12545 [Acidobacteria bacterium]|nr:hypothetical protein [Acidobacteriota bacterium]
MADSSISRLIPQVAVNNKLTGPQAQAKVNPSKFDQVRSKLEKPAGVPGHSVPQEATHISPQEKKRLEEEFKKRIEEVRLRALNEIFKADLRESKEQVDAIRRGLSTQPSTPALDPLKDRLLYVENQYMESGRLLRGLGKMESPEDYLKMQLQMYRLTQSVELLSKIAGEVVGGVNKVLSTQV